MDLYGRDLICTQDWSRSELEAVLDLAAHEARPLSTRYTGLLQHKTFFMFFYNPSVRTRQSFRVRGHRTGRPRPVPGAEGHAAEDGHDRWRDGGGRRQGHEPLRRGAGHPHPGGQGTRPTARARSCSASTLTGATFRSSAWPTTSTIPARASPT